MTGCNLIVADRMSFARGSRVILPEMQLRLRTGELTVVAGPNGAGKSTLLRLLTGTLKPSTGSISFGGTDIGAWRHHDLARRRAVLSQSSQLVFPFTVREVVEMGLDDSRSSGSRRLVSEMLHLLALGEFEERQMQELSGGEQQRVHLARVLCQLRGGDSGEPQYLFLDEPTSSLDLKQQVHVLDKVQAMISPNLGAFVVLHDLNLASAYADRLIVMESGVIVADGPRSAVLSKAVLEPVYGVELVIGTAGGLRTILPAPNQEHWRA